MDTVGEVRGLAQIQEAMAKLRVEGKYNSRVFLSEFKEEDLVIKKAQPNLIINKLSPKWVGPYKIIQVVRWVT